MTFDDYGAELQRLLEVLRESHATAEKLWRYKERAAKRPMEPLPLTPELMRDVSAADARHDEALADIYVLMRDWKDMAPPVQDGQTA